MATAMTDIAKLSEAFLKAFEPHSASRDPRRPAPDANAFIEDIFHAMNIGTKENIEVCT
jgi:hypothetical protein